MRAHSVIGLVLAVALSFSGVAADQGTDTLYKRLGGYDAIAAVTDDFIGRMAADKELSGFFTHMSGRAEAHEAARGRPAVHGHWRTLPVHRP